MAGAALTVSRGPTYPPNMERMGSDRTRRGASRGLTAAACALALVAVAAPPAVAGTPPVTVPDVLSLLAGGTGAVNPLANDRDPDLGPLTLVFDPAAVPADRASATVAADGTITFTAAPGFLGSFVVPYAARDAEGSESPSTITVTVAAPPNRKPVTTNDRASVRVGRTITVRVLDNDRDPDGDALRLVGVSKPSKGVARRAGSAVKFRAPKTPGTVRVRYTVADARGARATGVLKVTVTRKPAPAVKPKPSGGTVPDRRSVEAALARLGLPGGDVDGSYTALTRRAVCAWRTVTGRPASRALPTRSESIAIVATKRLPAARPAMVAGVNVSITCQAAFWVGANRTYRRVMAATTGIPSRYPTRLGVHRIFLTHRTWRTSTIYPEARMYKPMQFSGGQAIHGSATDRLVTSYPASHGCVRMLHRDIDALHAGGVGNGTLVRVFGRW